MCTTAKMMKKIVTSITNTNAKLLEVKTDQLH